VKLQPQSYEGHFLLGSALNRLEQFEEARTELELAVKLGGGNDQRVFYQLARAWGGLGKAPERRTALARFSELTKKQNDDAELQRKAAALIDEARGLLQKGDLENAAARLELAREAKPGDATLLFRLAGVNFDLKRYDAAREYVQAAISIAPATWLYHYLLGLIEQSVNHLADAKQVWKQPQDYNRLRRPSSTHWVRCCWRWESVRPRLRLLRKLSRSRRMTRPSSETSSHPGKNK